MPPEQSAWLVVLIAGIINLLYAIIYTVWTGISLLMGGMGAVFNIMNTMNQDAQVMVVVMSIIQIIAPIVQIICYPLLGLLSILTIVGGLRFRTYQSRGLVTLGTWLAAGVPLLDLVVSSMSACGCNCCGFVFGNIPTVVVFAIGLGATIYGVLTLRRPDVVDAFAGVE